MTASFSYSGTSMNRCIECAALLQINAKFCGDCGAPGPTTRHLKLVSDQASSTQADPQTAPASDRTLPPEIQEELAKTVVLLCREKAFLCIHAFLFGALNCIGLYLALHLYSGFTGDAVTKLAAALVPLMFLNANSLFFIIPFKGTSRKIMLLRHALAQLEMQIEHPEYFHNSLKSSSRLQFCDVEKWRKEINCGYRLEIQPK